MIALNTYGAAIPTRFAIPLVEKLFNHNDIAPFIGPVDKRPYDVWPIVQDPRFTIVFHDVWDAGCFVPSQTEPRVWEGHFLYTTLRGRCAVEFARYACRALFDETPAAAIVGLVPVDRFDARVMAVAIGCKRVGLSVDNQGRSCIKYLLER